MSGRGQELLHTTPLRQPSWLCIENKPPVTSGLTGITVKGAQSGNLLNKSLRLSVKDRKICGFSGQG